jgi:hypothetical protein
MSSADTGHKTQFAGAVRRLMLANHARKTIRRVSFTEDNRLV